MIEYYLKEAIKGRLQYNDENRLSQIFSASFNYSNDFRDSFLKFIEYNEKEELISDTQWYKYTKKRNFIDIIIYKKNGGSNKRPVIVIENKIECELTRKQLIEYDDIPEIIKIKPKYKIALVKYFFDFYNGNWIIKHWSEFYRMLHSKLEKTKDNKDKFIIENFLNYLKENNMALVESISKEDLNELAKIIFLIKKMFDGKAYDKKIDLKIFETSNNFYNILDFICSKVKEDNELKKIIGKNIQFSPHLGYAWDSDENDNKSYYCAFTFNITLRKEFKKIKHIRTGLFFDGIDKKKKFGMYLTKSGKNWKVLNNGLKEYKINPKKD